MRIELVDEVNVNLDIGDILAVVERIAFPARAVIGVDIYLTQVLQQIVFLLFGRRYEILIGWHSFYCTAGAIRGTV